jgi:hypothetical protein
MPVQYGGDKITFSDGSTVGSGWSGFKNRIINGAMMIDQRNAGASVTVPNTASGAVFSVDRWRVFSTQASKYTVQQNAGAVTPPAGFTNYLGVTSLSSYSVTSSDFFLLRQAIEGFNMADLGWGTANAQPITISFWVRSSLTGSFGGVVCNSDQTRSYPFTYTISTGNTWEQKSITIVGETTGTWITTNGTGIALFFGLGVGSTYNGTAGSWASAAYLSATGATSVVGTSGATFYITGVQLEKGSTATSFDYLDYSRSLIQCQRYFIRLQGEYCGQAYSSIEAGIMYPLPVTMRGSQTFVRSSGYLVTAGGGTAPVTAISAVVSDTQSPRINYNVASGLVAGSATFITGHNLTISSEL